MVASGEGQGGKDANQLKGLTVPVRLSGPFEALSYKIGELKFRELRTRAEKALGPAFDIRAFHTEVLTHGSVPLSVLEAAVDRWIAAHPGVTAVGVAWAVGEIAAGEFAAEPHDRVLDLIVTERGVGYKAGQF